MPTTTTNYSFNKPVVGGDEDAWGGYLNGNWDTLDTLLGGVTNAELSILDGATVTTAELNTLDGITATVTELNYNDITTLGTVEASKVVTADASGNVTFPDDEKAIFGTGSDLEIYHDGSHSYVHDKGTGNLTLRGTNLQLRGNSTNELYVNCVENGRVDLYYDNAVKIATSTTGVDITGGITEDTNTVTYASSIALSYSNGSIQTVTLTGNVTFTDSLSDGQAIVLMLNAGASNTVTWTAVDKWVSSSGNAAPTLTANDTIVIWKIGTTVYAAYAGSYT